MRAVRSRDTAPELTVRRMLRSIAPGYRLHRKDVLGNPDIVYLSRKKAIFVHGCFWHGHDCTRGARMPKANRAYWSAKIERNRARDARVREELEGSGWSALVIWECELRDERILKVRLSRFLASGA
jgi:DNA mismatch endonuclease (patch repair protein)